MNTTEQEQNAYDDAFNELADPQNGEAEEVEPKADPGVNDELTTEADAAEAETQKAEEAEGKGQEVDDPVSEKADEDDLEALKKERDYYKHGFDANRGRVSAYQKKINELETKLEGNPKPESDSESQDSTTENPDGSGMTDEQWTTFAEEYPELAEALEQKITKIDEAINARLGEIEHQVAPLTEKAHEKHIKAQVAILEGKHPDWQQVTSSDEFTKWINEQPKAVRELSNSMDASDASYLIKTFKATSGVQSDQSGQRRQERLRQSVNVQTKGGGRKPAGIPADYDEAFDFFAGQSK